MRCSCRMGSGDAKLGRAQRSPEDDRAAPNDKGIGPPRRRIEPMADLIRLIVFDFDGVVADSEALANAVLADYVTELGVPMSVDDCLTTFVGKRVDEVAGMVAAITRRRVPDFADALT